MELRNALAGDAREIALLHADSWRRTYRGSYSDEFLDGDAVQNRLDVWQERLKAPPTNQFVLLAEQDHVLQGFVCARGDDDPVWGSLVDNLHVRQEVKGRGIGASLMRAVGAWAMECYPKSGVYLWVLEANTAARGFYEHLGAANQGLVMNPSADGGVVAALRYTWPSPSALLEAR
ncbi:MAG: GNAT family N-acetyltransferase [Chloroflexota bacterium]|nr:GNAT family N-acetyltransferase [Chloroflexota bacterium]